jgi:uncharacterized protein (TIRG00374 family)
MLWKTSLKLMVGVVLMGYVIRSEMIDFRMMKSVLTNPVNIGLSCLFLALSVVLCTFRWYLLATAQGLSVSFRQIFELTMIGNFFNTFLPGSVGGDFIKAWYIAGHEKTKKTKAVFTVLLDRLIGLSVIVFYAAVTLMFFGDLLLQQSQLQMVALSVWVFTGGALLWGFAFFSPFLWKRRWFSSAVQTMEKLGPLGRITQAAMLYRHHGRSVVLAIFLSAFSILGITVLYRLHGLSLHIPLSTPYYFFVIPIGLVATAIPILPGGIGVGQVAFYTLFRWVGESPEQGSTLCTVLQIYTIIFNCLGIVFYLKYRQRAELTGVSTASSPT